MLAADFTAKWRAADQWRTKSGYAAQGVNKPAIRGFFRFIACAAALFTVVLLYTTVVHVNPTTVALTFLILVLIVSTIWGLRYALFTAFAATAAFNYYFLPPTGTFNIAETQNWIALLAFLITGVIASQLSNRARKQTEEALRRSEARWRLGAAGWRRSLANRAPTVRL